MVTPTPEINVVNTSVFPDDDFIQTAKQVNEPDFNGYEFYMETMGVTFYRKYRESSGLYEYKVHGIMDLDPIVCGNVYVDWEYRKKWDKYVLELHPIKDEQSNKEGLYWKVDFPFPMSDRDYTFIRDMKVVQLDGAITPVVLARSEVFPSHPEKSGVIRVDDYCQECAMQSDGKQGAKAYMHYYDNPKGMIPTWLINWGAKYGVPQFLQIMQDACKGYPQYLQEQGRELIPSPKPVIIA